MEDQPKPQSSGDEKPPGKHRSSNPMGKSVSTLGAAAPDDDDNMPALEDCIQQAVASASAAGSGNLDQAAVNAKLEGLKRAMEAMKMLNPASVKTQEEALKKKFNFWETQPVPKLGTFFMHSLNDLCLLCLSIVFR